MNVAQVERLERAVWQLRGTVANVCRPPSMTDEVGIPLFWYGDWELTTADGLYHHSDTEGRV